MLLVFIPISLVYGAVEVSVHALPVRFVVLPLALVDVTIRVNEPALAICLSVHPLPLVERTVRPDLPADSCPPLAFVVPLSDVDRTVCELEGFSLDQVSTCWEAELLHGGFFADKGAEFVVNFLSKKVMI